MLFVTIFEWFLLQSDCLKQLKKIETVCWDWPFKNSRVIVQTYVLCIPLFNDCHMILDQVKFIRFKLKKAMYCVWIRFQNLQTFYHKRQAFELQNNHA